MPVRIARTDDPVQLAEAAGDLDVLVNCALPQYGPSKTSAANQRFAASLVAACAGKHLVHLSSVAVYGDFISGREVLFGNPKPDTAYGRQKLQMEHLLRKLATKHSVRCTVLRVGHVYGPELRWSEAFFELIKNDGFGLPFGGHLPSNAIAIANVVAGIREIILGDTAQPTLNLTDAPQTTWRDVFDLHSQASGDPPVGQLAPYESERQFRAYKKWAETGMTLRLALETSRWVRQLPASYIASVPTFKALSQCAVAMVGSETLDAKLWAVQARRLRSGTGENVATRILPLFLSEPVPGPSLRYCGSTPASSLADLQAWHDAISAPRRGSMAQLLSDI
jgi:nucleoside-diphosphate-sugar epimerase